MTAEHTVNQTKQSQKVYLNGHDKAESIPPISLLDGEAMKLRLTIPHDWRRPKAEGSYKLYWSEKSQFGMLYPRPQQHETADFYNVEDYYTHEDSHWDHKPQISSFNSWLLKRLSWQGDNSVYIDNDDNNDWFEKHHGTAPCRVLDVGCGRGKILIQLQRDGHDVVGLEPDPVARKIARNLGLRVADGTAEDLPEELSNETFDAVIMTHVLEHFIDPVKAIRNAAQVLRKGGKLTIEVPNNSALGFENAGITWRWLDVPRHLNFFTPTSLRTICKQAGLTPITTEYRGYSRQFEPEWIQEEQKIWESYKKVVASTADLPRRPSGWNAWKLFWRTRWASDERKYDSVRVIAVKENDTASS